LNQNLIKLDQRILKKRLKFIVKKKVRYLVIFPI